MPYKRHALYDLTAGDGATSEYEDDPGSSPMLFAKHGLYRSSERQVPIDIFILEKAGNTYATLLNNLTTEMQMLQVRGVSYTKVSDWEWSSTDGLTSFMAMNADARSIDFVGLGEGAFIFLNNDPNGVHDWALKCESLITPISNGSRLTSMTTMGCNVGGLKRIDRKERDKWAMTVGDMNAIVDKLGTMDNLLVEILSDPSQWAYLLTFPFKWIDEEKAKIRRIFEASGLRINMYSARSEAEEFKLCMDRKFKTTKERRDAA
jgi:hypothetical protein